MALSLRTNVRCTQLDGASKRVVADDYTEHKDGDAGLAGAMPCILSIMWRSAF